MEEMKKVKEERGIVDAPEHETPPDMPAAEEFIGEKADWSEDISQYEKEEKKTGHHD